MKPISLLLLACLVAAASAACTTNPGSVAVNTPTLVAGTSRLTTDLKIDFNSPNGQLFDSVSFAFKSGGAYSGSFCDYTVSDTKTSASGLGSAGAWSVAPTLTGTSCDSSYSATFAGANFGPALSSCFVFDNTTDGTYNTYTASLQVVTVQPRNPIRGVAVTRTVTAYLKFFFRLQRNVVVSASPSVSGSNLVQADVLSIEYAEITPSAPSGIITVHFYTSTPAPYFLSPWVASGLAAGFTSTSCGSGGPALDGSSPYLAEITDVTTYQGQAVSCAPGVTDGFCTQLWSMRFHYNSIGTGGCQTCTPSTTLRFSFRVFCNGVADCVNPGNTAPYDITTPLSVTNLCSQLVQTTTVTSSVGIFASDTAANAGTPTSAAFSLNDRVYIVTSLTSNNGPALTSASLVSFNIASYTTITGITLANNKGVHGVSFTTYAPTGATIRPSISFILDTNAIQFSDLNAAQAVTVTITWTVTYALPASTNSMNLQRMYLLDTPASEDVQITTAFVMDNGAATASSSGVNTLAVVIGAVGGFCVLVLVGVLILLYRKVRKVSAANNKAPVMQVFVPMTSSSDLAPSAPAPANTATAQV